MAGEEIGSEGIMVDLAWPDSRIAVIFAQEPDDDEGPVRMDRAF